MYSINSGLSAPEALLLYLEEDMSQDLHVLSDQTPSIWDTSAPPDQQLSAVYSPLPPERRHHQVALLCPRGRPGSMPGDTQGTCPS